MKIVENKLSTRQWNVLNYLKENAVGKENAISGNLLSDKLNMSRTMLRQNISSIRKKQEIIIGSDTQVGYYIPLQKELKDALRYGESKTLSHLKSSINQNPSFALKVFKMTHEWLKQAPKELQDQVKMKFNGWETDTVNYVGDKYAEWNL